MLLLVRDQSLPVAYDDRALTANLVLASLLNYMVFYALIHACIKAQTSGRGSKKAAARFTFLRKFSRMEPPGVLNRLSLLVAIVPMALSKKGQASQR